MTDHPGIDLAATGVAGLDAIIAGGLTKSRLYLVEGDPGAGKTTLALQFLREGARLGEQGLYVTLSESEEELRAIARSHGWDLEGIGICDLQSTEESLKAEAQYTVFHPSEVELTETTRTILDSVEQTSPRRVVVDSLSEMRMLARDPLRYRRQILALKQYLTERHCTVLLLDYGDSQSASYPLESVAHGVIRLEQLAPEYGGERRRLRIQKIRGQRYGGGYHDFAIRRGGLEVFPRLVAMHHPSDGVAGEVSSGIRELDSMLKGGLTVGSSTMLLGPSGVGKSTLCAQCVHAANARGDHAVVLSFEEPPTTWVRRAEALGVPVADAVERGLLRIVQVDPAQLSPGEVAFLLRRAVEEDGARLVVIDSLNGYLAAMPEERFLTLHVHELLAYLGQKGVTTLLVMAQHGLLGANVSSPVDLSYVADTVILLRFFEAQGAVRHALSVVKKRTGDHERTIRELTFGPKGVRVGEQLTRFHGVLTGNLVYSGGPGPLLDPSGT